MFEIKSFDSPERAAMYMWDYFRQFQWTIFDSLSMFQITHSVNQDEVTTEQVSFDDLFDGLINFLRDLDAQEGMYCDNEEGMDFDETPEAQDRLYKKLGTKNPRQFGLGGEGFMVLKNQFASAKGEFPFVVVKQSHYLLCGDVISQLLKVNMIMEYTSRVVPAIYVELGDLNR